MLHQSTEYSGTAKSRLDCPSSRTDCLDQILATDKLSPMGATNVGLYLAEQRKNHKLSLDQVSRRMGRGRLTKQALSLIERGRMRVPRGRLPQLKRAYGLNRSEQAHIDRLYSFERLVEQTGYEAEFGEAVLSLVDSRNATSIHVIGGKALTLTSPILQARAAEFLQRPDNKLVFIEPDFEGLAPARGTTWIPTSNREMSAIRDAIQSFSLALPTQASRNRTFCSRPQFPKIPAISASVYERRGIS